MLGVYLHIVFNFFTSNRSRAVGQKNARIFTATTINHGDSRSHVAKKKCKTSDCEKRADRTKILFYSLNLLAARRPFMLLRLLLHKPRYWRVVRGWF